MEKPANKSSGENHIESADFLGLMKKIKKWDWLSIVPYLGLILILIVFSFTSNGNLFGAYNVSIVVQQTVALAIVCLGGVFVYSMGNLDISIGATIGLCTLIQAIVLNATGNLLLAFMAALLLALSFGLINGAVSSWLGLPSVITSLFLMFIGTGVQTIITLQTNTIRTSFDFSFWKNMYVQIGALVIMFSVVYYLFNYTRLGKYTSSIGANLEFAKQSGVNVFRNKIYAYLIMGTCVAIASLFILARSGSSSRVTGAGYHMDVMVALILGGMPLSGGMKSKVSAALIGSFSYILLTNGLTLSGVAASNVPLVKALIFAVIVIITSRKKGVVLPR